MSGTDTFILDIFASLAPEGLETGVPTIYDLETRFVKVQQAVRQVAHVPADGGFWSHALSYLVSAISFQPHGLVPGDDVESVVTRAEYHLRHGDLEQVRCWLSVLFCNEDAC